MFIMDAACWQSFYQNTTPAHRKHIAKNWSPFYSKWG
jgi:hypothetical protein